MALRSIVLLATLSAAAAVCRADVSCAAGTYYYGRVQAADAVAMKDYCVRCATGRFSAGCVDCCEDRQATACHDSFAQQPKAADCKMGTYFNLALNDHKSAGMCTNCPVGKWQSLAGQQQCYDCPQGMYQPAAGLWACYWCPVGKYQQAVGGSTCTKCDKCQRGQYGVTTGSHASAHAVTVGTGTVSASGCSCATCSAGKYAPAGYTTCFACPAGRFQPTTGHYSCYHCPIGKFSTTNTVDGIAECISCPTGQTTLDKSSVSQESCMAVQGIQCQVGQMVMWYEPNQQNYCIDCPAGSFGKAIDNYRHNAHCFQCPEGKFQPAAGKPVCDDCVSGQWTAQRIQGQNVTANDQCVADWRPTPAPATTAAPATTVAPATTAAPVTTAAPAAWATPEPTPAIALKIESPTPAPTPVTIATQAPLVETCVSMTVDQNSTEHITCPAGVISKIVFASYGTPTGTHCDNFQEGECHSQQSMNTIKSKCYGKKTCELSAIDGFFEPEVWNKSSSCLAEDAQHRIKVSVMCSGKEEEVGICRSAYASQGRLTEASCPDNQVISEVTFASYGLPLGTSCDNFESHPSCHSDISATVLTQRCLGHEHCQIMASDVEFGHTCTAPNKYLKMAWKCLEKINYQKTKCIVSNTLAGANGPHIAPAQLQCPVGQTIDEIHFASFGVFNGNSCNTLDTPVGGCHAVGTKRVVEAECLNKEACTVPASTKLFGDPCPDTPKSLGVSYTCNHMQCPHVSCAWNGHHVIVTHTRTHGFENNFRTHYKSHKCTHDREAEVCTCRCYDPEGVRPWTKH